VVGYRCEWCKRDKEAGQRWLLALAAEQVTKFERKREIHVLRGWNATWARHPLAVHFCCNDHLESYVAVMFAVTHKKRTQLGRGRPTVQLESHLAPGAPGHYEAPIERRHRAATSSRKSRTRKLKITKLDIIRAHGMGIVLR
jgi:hypothetical protein